MCGKPLPCGHKCQEKCHDGNCKDECKQPCLIKRKECSHKCGGICHYPHECPSCNVSQLNQNVLCIVDFMSCYIGNINFEM